MNCKECIHGKSDVIYAEGYRQGALDMEKAKQVVIDALLKHIETVRAETIEELKTELTEIIQGDEEFTDWQKGEILICLECAIEQMKGGAE